VKNLNLRHEEADEQPSPLLCLPVLEARAKAKADPLLAVKHLNWQRNIVCVFEAYGGREQE